MIDTCQIKDILNLSEEEILFICKNTCSEEPRNETESILFQGFDITADKEFIILFESFSQTYPILESEFLMPNEILMQELIDDIPENVHITSYSEYNQNNEKSYIFDIQDRKGRITKIKANWLVKNINKKDTREAFKEALLSTINILNK